VVTDDQLAITCAPAEQNNRRKVVVKLGAVMHVDRFDVDQQFVRAKWREAVVSKFSLDDDAHEYLEQKLMKVAEAADENDDRTVWQPSVVSLDDIAPQQTDWLWQDYLPAGTITVIDGDPGLGKSQLTIDLAARLSRGDAMPPASAPDGMYSQKGTLILNAEDDPSRTLRPRLDAAGATMKNIHLLRHMDGFSGEQQRPVSLPLDLAVVENVVRHFNIGLCVLDPFVAYLDGKLSMNSDADVRRCLGQVAVMAERTGAAVLLVRHLNKKSGLSAIYRGGGSIGITGAARAVFMVGEDPTDPDSRILACVKCNLAPEPPSLRFHIESVGTTSRVRWGDSCEVSAADMLQGGKSRGAKLNRAKEIIEEILGTGPRGSNEVLQACKMEQIGESTFHKARKALGIQAEKESLSGGWLLTLPSQNGAAF